MKNTEKSLTTLSVADATATPSRCEGELIRTFGRTHGKKLSARQQWLVENLLPKLSPFQTNVGADYHPPRGAKYCAPTIPAILEIGFGAGEHLLHLAETNPDAMIIGAEPFMNGVASLLSRMTYDVGAGSARPSGATNTGGGLTPPLQVKPEYRNIRIWPDDIRKLLNNCTLKSEICTLQNVNFEKIYILHPDPWPKARHEKRRLLSAEFLNELGTHLAHDGQIIIGTDHYEYYDWILEQIKKTNLKSEIRNQQSEIIGTRYQRKNKAGTIAPKYITLHLVGHN